MQAKSPRGILSHNASALCRKPGCKTLCSSCRASPVCSSLLQPQIMMRHATLSAQLPWFSCVCSAMLLSKPPQRMCNTTRTQSVYSHRNVSTILQCSIEALHVQMVCHWRVQLQLQLNSIYRNMYTSWKCLRVRRLHSEAVDKTRAQMNTSRASIPERRDRTCMEAYVHTT